MLARPTAPGAGAAPGLVDRLAPRWVLVAVLALAAALRLVHVLALRPLPLFERLIIDSQYYDEWARRIAAGDWMGGDRAFFFDPLYTYLLAGLYRLAGHDLLLVRLFQVALGVGTCALVALIGRRVAGPGVGNLAALLVALYQPAIFQEGEVEKTALGVFLLTSALAFLTSSRSPGARLAAGATLALAALTRGNMILVVPIGVVYLLASPAADAPGGPPRRWRDRLRGPEARGALLFLVGFLVALAPVAWRNHRVSGEWILTTAGAGTNFYVGNNPANATGGYQNVPFVRPQSLHEEDDYRSEAEARTGRRLGPGALSAYWFGEAWRHIRSNPAFAAQVFFRKAVLALSHTELPDGWDMYFLARYSPVLRLPLLGMASLLPLAAVGACTAFRRSREVRLLVAYVAVYFLSLVAFYVFSRYRLHVLPALAVLGAMGASWVVEELRGARIRRVVVVAAAAVPLALFSVFGAAAFVGVHRDGGDASAVNLAGLHLERGEYAPAADLLAEVLQRRPTHPGALCRAGEMGLRAGNFPAALEYYTACLRSNPSYPDAWYHLGVAHEAMGHVAEAAAAYDRQVAAVPGHELARARRAALPAGAR